jgi:AsmA family protein
VQPLSFCRLAALVGRRYDRRVTLRTRRWLLIALAAVATVVIAIAVLLASLDLESLARANLGRVEAATGRALTIDGPLRVRLWPRPAVVAERVALANAPFGSAPHMATAQRVEAALEFWPLLRGRLEVARLVLLEPHVLLETDAKGRGNWELTPAAGSPSKGPAPAARTPQFDIASLQIDNGRVTWRPAGRAATTIELRRFALDQAAGGQRAKLQAEVLLRTVPVSVAGTIGSLARLVEKQADWPLDLRLSLAGVEATAVGRVDASAVPPAFVGKIDAKASDLQALSKLTDTQIALPTPIVLAAEVESAQRHARFDPLSIQLGKSTINGSLALRTGGARPFINAQLSADDLDLARPGAQGSAKAAASPAGGGRLFSAEKLPFELLRATDGQFALNAAKLRTPGGTALAGVRLQASLKDGRLLAEPLDFAVAGGKVTVRGDLRAAAQGAPRTVLAINAKAVDLGALLAAAGHRVLSGGATDLQADVAMSGASLREMAASVSGPVRISIGPGRVTAQRGDTIVAVLEALRPGTGGDALQLACAVAVLPFNAGIAVVDRTIAFESPQLNAVASGNVDLRQETLDLALRPSAPQGDGGRTLRLAQLVRVHGPLASPKVGIDAARVAEEALAAALRRGLRTKQDTAEQPVDANPCRTALTGKPPAMIQPKPAAPAQPALDVEDTLRRLFRR